MVIAGEIKFENKPFGIFYAGEIINGKFILNIDESSQIKSIRVNVRGFSKCEWTRWTGDKIKHYKESENYFESNSVLFSSGGEPVCMSIGTQSYPFSFELTRTVPCSFEGKYGYIRYQVTVIVERPLRPDYTCLANFSVINQYDLNNIVATLQSTFEKEKIKYFCCGVCESKPLKIKINLPRNAFIPGELIPIEINVRNDSNVRIVLINLYLIKNIKYQTFVGKPGEKKERFEISKLTLEGIPKYSRKQLHTHFIVSHVAPSNLGLCKLMTINYEILVNFIAPSYHCDVSMTFPIIIGTSSYNQPVTDDNTAAITAQPMPQAMSLPYPIGFVYPPPMDPSLKPFINADVEPSAPPPGYEETVYGQKM